MADPIRANIVVTTSGLEQFDATAQQAARVAQQFTTLGQQAQATAQQTATLTQAAQTAGQALGQEESAAAQLGAAVDRLITQSRQAAQATDQLGSESQQTGQALSQTDSAMTQAAEAAARYGTTAQTATDATDRLGTEATKVTMEFGRIAPAATQAATATDRLGNEAQQTATQVDRLGTEAQQTGQQTDRLGTETQQTGQRLGGFRSVMQSALAVVERFRTTLRQTGDDTERAGQRARGAADTFQVMTVRAQGLVGQLLRTSAALAGFQGAITVIRDTTKSVVDFETELAKAGSRGGLAANQLGQIRQQVLALNPALGQTADLARAVGEALSVGVEPANAVKFVALAAQAARANYSDLNTIVQGLTQTLISFGVALSDTQRLEQESAQTLDILSKAVQVGSAEFDDLFQALGVVAPLAGQFGLSIKETAGILATLSTSMGNTDRAATAFQSALNSVIVNMAAFREAGIDVNEVLSERGFLGLIQELQRVTGGSAEAVSAYITDVQGLNAVVQLMGPTFGLAQKNVDALGTATGDNARKFTAYEETTRAALDRLRAQWDRLAQENGPALLRELERIANFLRAALPQAAENTVTSWGALRLTFVDLARASAQLQGNIVGAIATIIEKTGSLLTWIEQASNAVDRFFGTGKEIDLPDFSATVAGLREYQQQLQSSRQELDQQRAAILAEGTAAEEAARKKADAAAAYLQALREQRTAQQQSATEQQQSATQTAEVVQQRLQRTQELINQGATQAQAAYRSVEQAGRTVYTNVSTAAEESSARQTQAVRRSAEEEQRLINAKATTVATAYQRIEQDGKSTYANISLSAQQSATTQTKTAQQSATAVSTAYHDWGLKTTAELTTVADNAVQSFQTVLTSGTETPAQIQAAWQKTAEEIRARYGTLPPQFAQVEALLKQGNTAAVQAIVSQWDQGLKQIATSAAQLPQALQQTVGPITQLLKDLGITTTHALQQTGQSAADMFTQVVAIFGVRSTEAAQAAQKLEGTIRAGYERLPPHVDRLLRLVTDANTTAADESARAHEDGAKRIKGAYDFAANAAYDFAVNSAKVTGAIRAGFTTAADGIIKATRGTFVGLERSFDDSLEGLREKQQHFFDLQQDLLNSFTTLGAHTFVQLRDYYRNITQDIANDIATMADIQIDRWGRITYAVDEATGATDEHGESIKRLTNQYGVYLPYLERSTASWQENREQLRLAREELERLREEQERQVATGMGGGGTGGGTGGGGTGSETTGGSGPISTGGGSPTGGRGGSPTFPSLPPPVQLPGSGGSIAIGQPPAQVPGNPIPPGYGGVQLPGFAAAGFSAAEQLSTGTRATAGSGGTTLSIGNVTINTQSRNAEELARDLVPALNNELRSNRLQPQLNSNVAHRR